MNVTPHTVVRRTKWYERLISCYPSSYLAKHREELLQNFEDLERDMGSTRGWWAFLLRDFIKSITKEYMHYLKNHRGAQLVAVMIVIVGAAAVWQFFTLQKAHRSFANYSAFRGCVQITSQSSATGTCTLANGQSITMVQVDGRWYLQGDLPICVGRFCL